MTDYRVQQAHRPRHRPSLVRHFLWTLCFGVGVVDLILAVTR